ncbi:MAG: gephyrin-like molybdotransferase Glp [Myxococcota bacterium]
MLSVSEARDRILAHVPPNGAERVFLAEASGRLLAEDVVSPRPLPPWPASAMDGFAVRASDVPGTLRVIETVGAGAVGKRVVGPGEATRIMTGAPVPEGADAVVMVEDTSTDGEAVTVRVAAKVGQHVRARGSEVPEGVVVLRKGAAMTPGAVGACAALGIPSVRVALRPRVGVLSTGDEVVETGLPLGPGQIHSSNNHALAALVCEAGGVPVDLGTVRDDPAAMAVAFREGLAQCDVLLSTGGVSVGDYDHVKGVLAGLGVAMDFWKVAMKPGKPLAFGTFGGRPVFGLPGNPVSCMVNFHQFVRPLLRTMLGDPNPYLPVVTATVLAPRRRATGRPEFVRVRLARDGDRLVADVAGHQGSAGVLSMAAAHGYALVPADAPEVAGTLSVQVFDWSFTAGPQAHVHFGGEGEGCC